MEQNLYYYRANVVRVYDGDTCTVDLDLGFYCWLKNQKIRLARIDTPELRGSEREAGLRSRDALRKLILDKRVTLQTMRDQREKYGRWLAEIWLEQVDGSVVNVNDWLLDNGYAKPYK